MPSASTPVLIVERNGELRPSEIKEHSQLELAKKCKYKTSTGFEVRAEWAYSGPDAEKFIVELWAREDGAAGQENKYEFPPPVDTILFFGACALVAKDMSPQHNVIPLTLEKWDKMYNFLFGGFDTLTNCYDDDDEYDELDSVPAHRKTKDGYLKDGFVVDEAEDVEEDEDEDDEDDTEESEYDDDEEPTTTDCEDNDESDDSCDTDDNDDNGAKAKCGIKGAKGVASKKKHTVTKKRGTEAAIPSFELMEEPYEYLDD